MKALIPQIVILTDENVLTDMLTINLSFLGVIGNKTSETTFGEIGKYCHDFTLQQVNNFCIGNNCIWFSISNDVDYFDIGSGANNFHIKESCTRFSIKNGANGFWINSYCAYFVIGLNSGQKLSFPSNSKSFVLHNNVNRGSLISFINKPIMLNIASKSIMLDVNNNLILTYIDTGEIVVETISE